MGILQTMCFFIFRYDNFPDHMYGLSKCIKFKTNCISTRQYVYRYGKVLYKTDTPTNVLPSIHVFNSIGAGIAISHSNDLKKHRWIQISAYILAALIILSTMFLKQHSVTDVIAAVTMACIYLSIRICCSRQESS